MKFVFISLSNELGGFESGATAALFGAVPSVVGGGLGTIVVAALVAWRWPQLVRIGPLATLHIVEHADHMFHVPKKSGRTDEQVKDELADTIETWSGKLGSARA